MASYQEIDIREPSPHDIADPILGPEIRALEERNQRCWIWDILTYHEAPDALAEIRVDFTDDFDDGETTAIVLYVIGAAANEDKAAGTGANKVTIYGYDANGDPQTEEVTLNAAANTQEATTATWKRFVGAVVTQCGSGGVNAGIIQITNTGQAEVYGTIAVGELSTIGPRVYIPSGWTGFIASLAAACVVVSHATAEVVYGTGAVISPTYLKDTVTRNAALDKLWVNPDNPGMQELHPKKLDVVGANTRYISYSTATKADDVNDAVLSRLKVIIYKQNIGG